MTGLLRLSDAYTLAFHAITYMAAQRDGRPVAVTEMAGTFHVSQAHLSKVLQRLAKLGLLVSRRGPRGGFSLGRQATDVTLLEIHEAIDGPLPKHSCLLGRSLCAKGSCVMAELVRTMSQQFREHMAKTRLSDVKIELPEESAQAAAAG